MLRINSLIGFGARQAGAADAGLTATYHATHVETTDRTTTATASSMAIGTASSDRYVVAVVVGRSTSTFEFTTCTVGGASMTRAAVSASSVCASAVFISDAPVTSGTTADIEVGWTGTIATGWFAATYSIVGSLNSTTATDTLAAGPAANDVSGTIDVSAGGCIIAGGMNQSTSPSLATFSPTLTADDDDISVVGRVGAVGSHNSASGETGRTITLDFNVSATNSTFTAAAFR